MANYLHRFSPLFLIAVLAPTLLTSTSCISPQPELIADQEKAADQEKSTAQEKATTQEKTGTQEKTTTQEKTAVPEDTGSWKPLPPVPKEFDWIRFNSGEWLKGDIDILREGNLEFDSDELGDLKIDWDDIAELHSPRMNSCLFEDKVTAYGTLLIRDDIVLVGGDEEQRFERKNLLTIIPGELRELNFWSGKVSLGFTGRSGNTNQTDATGLINIYRQTLSSRFIFEYNGTFSKLNGEESANNHNLSSQYDLFITSRFYVTPAAISVYRDRFQNIDIRVTPAVGGGYHIIDQGDMELDVTLGAGYRYTRFESVEAFEDDTDTTAAALGGIRFDVDLTKKIELSIDYTVQVGVPETKDTNQHALALFSIELMDVLDLDLTFVWDRVGDPAADSNGVVPENDDFRFTVGLGIEF